MRALASSCALACIVMGLPASATAQPPTLSRNTLAIEAVAAAYMTDHPEGGPVGLGLAVLLERRLARRHGIRFALSMLQTLVTADNISLCHLLPDGGCLPDSIFPGILWIGETSYLLQPLDQLPLRLLVGGGFVLPRGHPEGHGAVDDPSATADPSASWRLGLEARLGQSPRAPRLQLTRLGLLREMMSLEGLAAITLQLRFR